MRQTLRPGHIQKERFSPRCLIALNRPQAASFSLVIKHASDFGQYIGVPPNVLDFVQDKPALELGTIGECVNPDLTDLS